MSDYFEDIVGQEPLKRKLGFHLDAFKVTSRMPFLFFGGAKGVGKTRMMKEMARNILGSDGRPRKFLELNCSVIKNNQMFFEHIWLQFMRDQELTVAWDEAHNLPKDLSQVLLTICNTENEAIRDIRWNEQTFTFDMRRQVWMFASTEADKIFPPLRDRFDVVDFDAYSHEDLKEIIVRSSDGMVIFEGEVLDTVANHVRGNARSCVKMAENVVTYCRKNEKITFGIGDWRSLAHSLSILPMGLTSSEVIILRELKVRGACSLNMLASATGMSRTSIMADTEQYLLKKDLVRIDGKRKITEKGQRALEMVGG